ncbi:CPBP family intramembrane glutamic endopeptidase [Actinoplanes utahensis]|uniref:CPBP family intramembrane glutamic endopeptidase n=1 Tax=Actinoplanes utahensis TaxID=1869 RepID=UPI0006909DCD|nr:type II CAAX endopeptidase family protein [Actinoplanes utahensis]GIF35478.1 hypothetical protein Aut01nite_84640 [Actinoplanes utahensis]
MTTTSIAPSRPRLPLPVRALLTLVAMFAAAFSGYVALVLPAGPAQHLGACLCASAAGIGLAIALVRGIDRRPIAALGLGRPAGRACLVALTVTAACTAAGTALAAAAGLTTSGSSPQGPVLLGVLMMLAQAFLLQAVPEEVLFRGYLVQTALGRLPLWGVTALSVLVFTVPHLLSSSGADTVGERLTFLLLPLGFALPATAFRLRTGSVWPAVTVHGGFHVSSSVAGLWAAPRPESYGAYLAVIGGVFVLAGLVAARHVIRHAGRD